MSDTVSLANSFSPVRARRAKKKVPEEPASISGETRAVSALVARSSLQRVLLEAYVMWLPALNVERR